MGALVAPSVAGVVESPNARAGLAVLVLLAVAAIGNAAGWFIGVHARDRAANRFGKADSVAGSAVAVVASFLAIWFIALNLANGPFPSVASEIRGRPWFARSTPRSRSHPRCWRRSAGCSTGSASPTCSRGSLPSGRTRRPTDAGRSAAAAAAAASSTVQVIGPA